MSLFFDLLNTIWIFFTSAFEFLNFEILTIGDLHITPLILLSVGGITAFIIYRLVRG